MTTEELEEKLVVGAKIKIGKMYAKEHFCTEGEILELAVRFFEPFQGTITSAWRSVNEVELFEVDELEYNQLVESYDAINAL